ncbi:hypothetical protein Sjap_016407 [Stephania japonica]|uniref:ABC transporter C family member 3 n=1 Tax=Stephania japonica TaxID=461633 RepID=A0AAP0NTR7_9MAGN
MEISLRLVNLAFYTVSLAWVMVEFMKERRRDNTESKESKEGSASTHGFLKIFTKITIASNTLISIFYLAFCVFEAWTLKTISIESALKAATWVVFTAHVFLLKNKRWPFVLLFWWVLSTIVNAISVFINFKVKQPSKSLLKTNFADLAALPFSILLCFNVFRFDSAKRLSEFQHHLLHKEDGATSANTSLFAKAGLWSKLTFKWLNPLFVMGNAQKLDLLNVPSIPESETAEEAFSLLQESIQRQKTETLCLSKAIMGAIWRSLTVNAIFAGINTVASYIGPLLITSFFNFLSGNQNDLNYSYGVVLSFLFFFAKTVESLTQRQWYFGAHRIGIRVRAALIVAIHRKTLSVKNLSMSNGNVVNFINVDVERISDFCWYIHGVWLLPFQVFLALIILYRNLSWAPTGAALFATVMVMVSNIPLASLQERLHTKIMEAKDSRTKATSETLRSMRVLKLHSWEAAYLRNILKLRETERTWLKRYLYTCATVAFLFWTSPTLVSAITFGVGILFKTPLTSGAVLSALATFRILQEPIYNLPELISMIAQTKVSIDRIQDFIGEVDQMELVSNYAAEASNAAVEIERGEYTWETSNTYQKKPAVKITKKMKIMKGDKVAVCGSVGSGKSSLLCSILGEISRISGARIKVNGSKAYVPQSAWIQSGSIRENVLFGKEMEKGLYQDVLKACALHKDIDLWADGDWTLVGERGLSLSGGQKQRIQLARAIYSNSDVYLLDDPFSAVDAHTGAHLFKECLMGLLSQKTVIYVTHQLEFLDASDLVLVMKDGKIVQSGKFEELIAEPYGELVKQMTAHSQSLSQVTLPHHCTLLNYSPNPINQAELVEEDFDDQNKNNEASKRINEETESGRVNWQVYSTFVTSAYKGALVPVILLCQALFQVLQISSNYWIAWATEEKGRVSKGILIEVFVLLSGGSSIFILGRAFLLATISIETAQKLFLGMINAVFRAPISFFDSTPSSQILSRSSNDQSTVDTDIPYRVAGLAFALIQLLSIIILMSYIAWQAFLLFVAILAISVYYIATARELARMVGTRRSPIVHHFSESIAGAAIIRSFNQKSWFLKKCFNLTDDYSRLAFHNAATMEWLCVRINFLFNLVFFLVLIILVSLPRAAIDPCLAGLAATYGLNLNVLQAWVIWNLCNVENKMISVERIIQFSKIPSEAPLEIKGHKPEPDWPANGKIELKNLHIQYSPSLPMVLRGITCTFPGKRKIGVVGRTGSGKSTLIQALFRVNEPSEGKILIDGIDICTIGLQDLRSRLGIIPQDPTLFQGTMRTNLDPLKQHSDSEIWEALTKCRLLDMVRQDHRLLEAPVAEDGENWSVGERQLVCLARLLLKKRRILIIDEATASVDTATDNIMQTTIRKETCNCTVITVAHRIPTVIDSDLVLVLDEGKILEYDSPAELLKDSSSAFSKLVMEFLRRSTKRNH